MNDSPNFSVLELSSTTVTGDLTGSDFDSEQSALSAHQDFDHDPTGEESSTLALFDGDVGGLSLVQRRALVALLKSRFISAAQHPSEWRVIREDPIPIKARLNDLLLDLHLDLQHEVAFKRQAVPDNGRPDFPTLLRDTAYSREETILLAFLRHRFHSERSAGHDDVTIERADLLAHIASFRSAHATNRSGDESRANNAVDSLIKANALTKTNDPSRLRISPVIAVLVPLERLHELWEWLKAENGSDLPSTDQQTESNASSSAE